MHASLGPGETLLPEARAAAAKLLEDPRVFGVLAPLAPEGAGRVPQAARRYVAAWDARFLHRQTFFAPGARVITRDEIVGWRAADAAPHLARAMDDQLTVEALSFPAVATPIARDMDAWVRWARQEGAAWGALSRREPRFAPFAPSSWWAHNVLQAHRRVGEVAQAAHRLDPLATWLHMARGSAWTGACLRAMRA